MARKNRKPAEQTSPAVETPAEVVEVPSEVVAPVPVVDPLRKGDRVTLVRKGIDPTRVHVVAGVSIEGTFRVYAEDTAKHMTFLCQSGHLATVVSRAVPKGPKAGPAKDRTGRTPSKVVLVGGRWMALLGKGKHHARVAPIVDGVVEGAGELVEMNGSAVVAELSWQTPEVRSALLAGGPVDVDEIVFPV